MRLPGRNEDKHKDLLERNGYQAVRAEIMRAPATAGGIPLEVFDAAIAFTEASIGRLKLDTDERADAALKQADYELEVMKATRRYRAILGEIDDKQRARQALEV
jgi:hypothetical protein